MKVTDVPTPAALLDLDQFEANLARMAERVKQSGKALRPHAKAHKCLEISRRQLQAGACGVCVATVLEAELLANLIPPGSTDANILVTSPVADPSKMARIVKTGAMVVVDHPQQVAWYAAASGMLGKITDILVDLDVGDHRTGAATLEQAVQIAEAVERAANVRLKGIQAYSVVGSHGNGFADRQRISKEVLAHAVAVRDAFARKGLCTDILTGGSTGSWNIDPDLDGWTELQAGSYVVMDLAYRKAEVDFANALTILATVVSANHQAGAKPFVTMDAGYKALSADRGYGPEARDFPGSTTRWGGDEFTYLDLEHAARKPKLGEKIHLLPPHCDPTMNLYDRVYAYRGELVEAIWPLKRTEL
jgi:D-serine deaminase-like pyridoxal phosphate-dependent protein